MATGINFVSAEDDVEHYADSRVLSLRLAVQFHGMASANPRAVPAGEAKVVKTANAFYEYLMYSDE